MNENPAFIQALQDLGMTRTESEVYLATLETSSEEPVSGYKVAQVMGRDPANLSKTLAHLVKVGAVRLVQARPRHYVGVPVAEFTEMLMARMEESREKAITLMAQLGSSAVSQQPTPLENTAHIMAQARRILSQSRGNVVLCCDDETLNQLEEFLEDMGRNFPDTAIVLGDSKREILGINYYNHDGLFPMYSGFSDNTTENWILVSAGNGQWLSAFYSFKDSSENTRGWVGTNHEISLPVKAIIAALLSKKGTAISKESTTSSTEEPSSPNLSPIEETLDEIEQAFEAGAMASVGNENSIADDEDTPAELPTTTAPTLAGKNSDEPETVDSPDQDTSKTVDGFKFLVQHEDDEEEEDDPDSSS